MNVSGNTSITRIEAANNTSLISIDLTGSGVQELNSRGCTGLREIKVAGNGNIVSLDVSETPLTVLDVSNCSNLHILNCDFCDLSILTLNGCTNLDGVLCRNNSLSMLDVSMLNLTMLKCEHQIIHGKSLLEMFNVLDILYRRLTVFFVSNYTEEELGELANVKDMRAFDENGRILAYEYDETTGEITFTKPPMEFQYTYITGFHDVRMDVTVLASEEDDALKELEEKDSSDDDDCCSGEWWWLLLLPVPFIKK